MWLKIYLVVVLVVSVFTFVVLFGALPQLEGTAVWKFRKWLTSCPSSFHKWDAHYCGGNITRVVGMIQRTFAPIAPWMVPVLYCCFTTYMYSAYFEDVHPFIVDQHPRYKWVAVTAYLILASAFILATFSDPGIITKKNHPEMLARFKFDNILFLEDTECRTCKFTKPARSKHDVYTNKCVAKFDHYCLWINNTVGLYNYRWFLYFLVANVWTLSWGMYLTGLKMTVMVAEEYKTHPLPNVFYRWWQVMIIPDNKRVGIIFLLCLSTGILACAFTVMHTYYIYLGATTNETDKWGDVHAAIAEGTVWMYQRPGHQLERSILLQKDEEGRSNRNLTDNEKDYVVQHGLTLSRLEDHKPIVNIYDRGFFNNLMEVLFPYI